MHTELQIYRRDLLKATAASGAGALVGAPVVSEILHYAYSELSKKIRNKTPRLLDHVPAGSVEFGYWPHANDYFSYRRQFGLKARIVGIFIPNSINDIKLLDNLVEIQKTGSKLMLSFGFSVKDKNRHDKCATLARFLKKLPYGFMIRPNCEMNQHSLKKLYQIDDPEEFVIWWEQMYSIFMNENVNCEFVFSPNSTEDILNTDQIKPYIPRFGVQYATLDSYDRHRDYPHYKFILPKYSAYKQIAHDVAVLQDALPGIPFGITEFGSEERDIEFKTGLIDIAPYLGAQFVMSFEWDKSDFQFGEHETDWRSIKSIHVHRAIIKSLKAKAYKKEDI